MKIIIAPDSFKESLNAMDVAKSIESGFKKRLPDAEYVKIPMADGGEGTVQALVDATGGQIIPHLVTGPLGDKLNGFYGLLGDGETAVIEMAAASGLHLVPPSKRNPLITTSYGTGELIKAALDNGVKKIIIGIGGSATNDGGVGMIQALGGKFLDCNGIQLNYGGGALADLAEIDITNLDKRLKGTLLEVACDVDNPLCGLNGTSYVFGSQKGATPEMIIQLDKNLAHYANLMLQQLGQDVKDRSGSGAAGGMGAALVGLLNATLRSGVDIVMDTVKFCEVVRNADLVITGEGRIDSQSIHGKTPVGVARIAKLYGIPVFGIAGSLSDDCEVVYDHGIDALFSVVPGAMSLDKALKNAALNIEMCSLNVAKAYALSLSK
ncbi:glycerate kinase [Vibrio cholerae]